MWCDNVEGWLEDEERDCLNNLAKEKKQLILEIGSFAGKSSLAMAENTNSVIVTIDWFKGNPNNKEVYDKINMEYIKKSLIKSIEEHELKRIISIAQSSEEVLKWWHQPIDGIFIDGNHAIASLNIDGKFIDFVRSGGWIAFHDYYDHTAIVSWVKANMLNDKFIQINHIRSLIVFRKK